MTSVLASRPESVGTDDAGAVSDTGAGDVDISTLPALTFPGRALKRALDRLGPSPSSGDKLKAASTEQGQDQVTESPILDFPQVRHLAKEKGSERFVALQEWEGYVVSIQKDTFTAVLRDVTAGAHIEQEEAEFPRDDIADADAELLRSGAVFRWVIGYQTRTGTRRRVSQLVFRRLPQWTRKEIERASQEATQLAVRIQWE